MNSLKFGLAKKQPVRASALARVLTYAKFYKHFNTPDAAFYSSIVLKSATYSTSATTLDLGYVAYAGITAIYLYISGPNLTSVVNANVLTTSPRLNIQYIDFSKCPKLINLPINSFGGQTVIPPPNLVLSTLSSSMNEIDISSRSVIADLSTIPATVTSLSPPNKQLTFTGLRSQVRTLDLSTSILTSIPPISSSVETLYTPPGLTSLASIPSTVSDLVLFVSSKIKSLSTLTTNVTSLTTSTSLTSLIGLPSTVDDLYVISTAIKIVDLTNNTTIRRLTIATPSISTIILSGCTALTDLTVPDTVKTINLSGCNSLESFDASPKIPTINFTGSLFTTADTGLVIIPPGWTGLIASQP